MDEKFCAGRDFLRREGRVLDRRVFATCFEGAPGEGVVDALRAYRNDDGGFGHGLEPDKRCPSSLPIDVEMALGAMTAAGTADAGLIRGACDYLAKVAAQADSNGAVPLAFPVIEAYPRAAHWTEWTYLPGLNPTAGLVGLLYQLGARHPWLDEAARYCWTQLETAELPDEVHALSEALIFLAQSPDQDRAEPVAARILDRLTESPMFHLDPEATGYGLSPLHLAPLASSRWRSLFSTEIIEAHLDRMERDQQADGGWPIAWEPPSQASVLDWRGHVTLQSLRTLVSYGRLEPAAG